MTHRLGLIKTDKKTPLNKKQKEFNLLSNQIEENNELIKNLKLQIERYQVRHIEELSPLLNRYFQLKEELTILLDMHYKSGNYSKAENEVIAAIVLELTHELIKHNSSELLLNIYQTYNRTPYTAPIEDKQRILSEQMNSEESQKWNSENDEPNWKETQRASYINQQKLLARQNQNLIHSKATAKKIYYDLIKCFHPDLEQDEASRIHKTKLVQNITSAYKNNNFSELLQLHIDAQIEKTKYELNSLSSKVLNDINKQLKLQLQQTEETIEQLRLRLSVICNINHKHTHDPVATEIQFKSNFNLLKKENKYWQDVITYIKTHNYLQTFISNYNL